MDSSQRCEAEFPTLGGSGASACPAGAWGGGLAAKLRAAAPGACKFAALKPKPFLDDCMRTPPRLVCATTHSRHAKFVRILSCLATNAYCMDPLFVVLAVWQCVACSSHGLLIVMP